MALPSGTIVPKAGANGAELEDRALGPEVVRADEEHNASDEAEGMFHHEALHLPVVGPAPILPAEKGPADLNLACDRVIPVEARRADDLGGFAANGHERTSGREGLLEEGLEAIGSGAGLVRVLLPDQRVRGDGEERIAIGWLKRPKRYQASFERRLRVKGHDTVQS